MEIVGDLLKTYGLNVVILFLLLYYYFNKKSPKTYKKAWALIGAIAMLISLVVRGYIAWVDEQPKQMKPLEEVEIIGPKDPSL